MSTIRVLFVDDEVRLCRAWAKLIEMQADITLVGIAHQADGLDELLTETSPDIVLMDVSMPGMHPMRAVREFAARHPGSRFVMYSGHSDPEIVQMAIEAGAWGFVDKLADAPMLFDALRRVACGETVFPTTF